MENQGTKQQNTDEIDISQIFKWFATAIHNTIHSILYGIASIRNIFFNNKLFFIGLIILGLILGAVYFFLLKKEHYKSTLVFSCAYLNTRILNNTIDKFNLLCLEKDKQGLREVLGLDSMTALQVYKFEYVPFVSESDVIEMVTLREKLSSSMDGKNELVDKVLDKLVIENRNAYQISALVYDPTIVKKLEVAIVNYFKSSDYLTKRIEINRENLKARRAKLVRESQKLDSLKTVLFENYQNVGKTSRGSGNVFLGDEKLANPLDVFREDLAMNNEILEIDRELRVQPDIEVVDGFTTIKEPDSASLPQILFYSFWISLGMGYLIIALWRFDRLLASYNTAKA